MKDWLTFGFAFIVFATVIFFSASCSEQSGWNAGMNGIPMQGDGNPGVQAGTAPPGSGAVDYVPQGNY